MLKDKIESMIKSWLIDNESVTVYELSSAAESAMSSEEIPMELTKAIGYASSAAADAAYTKSKTAYYSELMYVQNWFRVYKEKSKIENESTL